MSAHLDWFLRRNQTQNNDEAAQRARMSASRDRMDFKSDRTSSADDRSKLTEGGDSSAPPAQHI